MAVSLSLSSLAPVLNGYGPRVFFCPKYSGKHFKDFINGTWVSLREAQKKGENCCSGEVGWGGAGGKGLRLAVVSKAQLAFRFGVWLQLGCTAVRPQSSQWANQSQSERTVIAPVFDYGEKQEASCSD